MNTRVDVIAAKVSIGYVKALNIRLWNTCHYLQRAITYDSIGDHPAPKPSQLSLQYTATPQKLFRRT